MYDSLWWNTSRNAIDIFHRRLLPLLDMITSENMRLVHPCGDSLHILNVLLVKSLIIYENRTRALNAR